MGVENILGEVTWEQKRSMINKSLGTEVGVHPEGQKSKIASPLALISISV